MQGSLRQHFVDLHTKNELLKAEIKRLRKQKAFLSTNLFDAKYAIRQMSKYIEDNHKLTFWQKIALLAWMKSKKRIS